MSRKLPDPETQLEVDEAILEYLIYVATAALLRDAQARGKDDPLISPRVQVDLVIQMVDSFLIVFRCNHPAVQTSAVLQFRLRLLRFAMLLTRRYVPSETGLTPSVLEKLRGSHRHRAARIISNRYIGLYVDENLLRTWPTIDGTTCLEYRRRIANTFTPEFSSDYYGTQESLSLLDTLPLFMALSAAQNVLQGNNVTELWMKLAARYMTQAVLEQYLVYGAEMHGAIEEGFAYGFDSSSTGDGVDSDELLITNLFWDGETEREIAKWKVIRDEHMAALFPSEGTSPEDHIMDLETSELSLVEFEVIVIDFLESLLHAQQLPLLMQIEREEITGASRKQSQAVKQRVLGNVS